MVDHMRDAFRDMVKRVGMYREEAFHFVREGLSHAAEHVHGQETESHQLIQRFLLAEQIDWSELAERYDTDSLPDRVVKAIERAGGIDKLDRHITGRELCWGLRDYALKRWGMLARTVLESWNVKQTADFGNIVFGFIECDLMQKQPGDTKADFEHVYEFDEAFDRAYRPLMLDEKADSGDTASGDADDE
ncbi:MAG: Minf_1886 family protein [Phycisphaerae bacterium]